MSSPTDGTAAALEAARRELVGVSTQLLDLQADTGSPVSQGALDEAIERLAARLLRVADHLPDAALRRPDVR
jgi:hypothetical protein